MTWPKAAASMAVFRGNQVLLAQRRKPPLAGIWSLPGGHIELGETAAEAAVREVREETAVDAAVLDVVGIRDVIMRDDAGAVVGQYVIAVHVGRWLSGAPLAGSDAADAAFFEIADLEGLALTEGAREMIARAHARLQTGR